MMCNACVNVFGFWLGNAHTHTPRHGSNLLIAYMDIIECTRTDSVRAYAARGRFARLVGRKSDSVGHTEQCTQVGPFGQLARHVHTMHTVKKVDN